MDDTQNVRRILALCLVGVPWLIYGGTWLMSPAYIAGFLNHPLGIAITVAALLISGLCWWIMQGTRSVIAWVCVFFFGVFPQVFIPMLGPALVTIMQALGPVFADDKSTGTSTPSGS